MVIKDDNVNTGRT